MEQLVKSIQLGNGRMLTIYDASKKIAGDRWQVTLVARMAVSVENFFKETNEGGPPISEIKRVLGDTVVYEVKKQRNFIDDKAKQTVFTDLLDVFLKFSVPYLSNPEFARRLILKQYVGHKNRISR